MDYTLREQSLLNFTKKHRSLSRIDEVKLVYGYRLFMLDLKKLIIIYSLAFMLGITFELLLVQIGFIIFRQVAFGLHASNFWFCLISSSIVFVGGTYWFTQIHLKASFIFFLFFSCVLILNHLAPISSKKIKIKGPKHRAYLRKKMQKRFLMTFILVIVLPVSFSTFLVYGVLIETFIIFYSYVTLKKGGNLNG